MQILCNILVQSVISSVVVIATNQTSVGINMCYDSYQKPDTETQSFQAGLQAYNVSSISFSLFSCEMLLVITTLPGNTFAAYVGHVGYNVVQVKFFSHCKQVITKQV